MTELHAPLVTTAAAGALGVIFTVLSARVVMGRTTHKVMLGDGKGDADPLFVAVRSHANFAEFVPLILLLIGLIEVQSGPTLLVKGLAGALVLARVLHPIGMAMPSPNPFRAGGFVLTITSLIVASVSALVTVLN